MLFPHFRARLFSIPSARWAGFRFGRSGKRVSEMLISRMLERSISSHHRHLESQKARKSDTLTLKFPWGSRTLKAGPGGSWEVSLLPSRERTYLRWAMDQWEQVTDPTQGHQSLTDPPLKTTAYTDLAEPGEKAHSRQASTIFLTRILGLTNYPPHRYRKRGDLFYQMWRDHQCPEQ